MNEGFKNEQNLLNKFNNKKYFQLSSFHQDIIRKIFPDIENDDLIKGDICNRASKPDIYLEVKDVKRFISIKSGHADGMHIEPIKDFILFLRKFDISKETQKVILLFHYGDGTLNGNGQARYNFDEMLYKMGSLINKANKDLNRFEIIQACFDRFVVHGSEARNIDADFLYYGDENYGVIISTNYLKMFVLSKRYEHIKTLHIGPMNIQPYLRDTQRKSKNQFKREYMQVKWHYLMTDIEYANNFIRRKHFI